MPRRTADFSGSGSRRTSDTNIQPALVQSVDQRLFLLIAPALGGRCLAFGQYSLYAYLLAAEQCFELLLVDSVRYGCVEVVHGWAVNIG